ncbi:MAG: NAD(+) synthase [Bacteroidales bacterium]
MKKVVERIRQITHDYVKNAGLKALIIGESGGIDSALTTVLLRPICDELGIKLIGRSITIETNTNEERQRSNDIGTAFCHDFKEIDLTQLYHTTLDTIEELPYEEDTTSKDYRLRVGNIKARLRMIYLYNLAQKHRGMVISTDNQTEWQLGFWTLHGDVGDFDPLFGLWKTEVYHVSKYICSTLTDEKQKAALQACIDCVPTDGLGITSSDVEQLGAKHYDEVDAALWAYMKDGSNSINPKVIARHKASAFKRVNPVFITREEIFGDSDPLQQ